MTVFLSLLAIVSVLTGMPQPTPATIAWIAKGEFCEPETVLPLPDGNLLVSNVCDFRQTGNGFLSLLGAAGEPVNWRIVDGLDAPLGMALDHGQLLVVDNNRLKRFNWPDYELLETVGLDTSVANDVTIGPGGRIYISDTARGQVIELGTDGGQKVLIGEARFPGANGIAFHGGYLYIGGERLWRVDLHSQAIEVIGPEWLTDIDGIEFEADGTLQATPVAGPLVRFRSDQEVEVLGGEGISSANHGYSAALGLALIPTGFDNRVIAIEVGARPAF